MECRLCLNAQQNLLDIGGGEGIQTNVAPVLYKHFRFCFSGELIVGFICGDCLSAVQVFDAFYTRIETIHNAPIKSETIFVEKFNVMSNDEWDYGGSKFDNNSDAENEKTKLKKKVKKRPKNEARHDSAWDCKEFVLIKQDENDDNASNTAISQQSPSNRMLQATLEEAQKARKPSYKTNYKSATKKETSAIFQCEICDIPFLTEYKLYCHTKEVHLVMPFKCPEPKCVESFDTQDNLDTHVKQNHTRILCPYCKKRMKLYYLPQHIKLYHDEDQRIVCDLCGNVSRNKNTHKTHHLLVHDVQPRLQCDICKEWSRNKNSLREHMRTRHIQKPEACSICGKISANKKALMKHKRFHFAAAREKYKCQVCGHGFRDSTKLKEHSYIHSGISDVHRCSYCEKSFRFASSMYAHRKKAHATEEQQRAQQKQITWMA